MLTSILFLVLAFILMLAPVQMLTGWGLELTTEVGLVVRRIAALYAGLSVMFFLVRNAEHSSTRAAVVTGTVMACTILACLGVYEFVAGHATRGILTAVFVEVTLVLAFMYVGVRQK